jgi:citrate lyase subunit beta/citryl-CoA lyase
MRAFDPSFLLFVPGDRPDRFDKALSSEAGGAILDLEDAVAIEQKERARENVANYLDDRGDGSRVAVRVNAPNSPWFADDLAMLRARRTAAIVLPKTPNAAAINNVAATLENDAPVIALLESAQGVLRAEEIAAHARCVALAFGPYDLSADLGCSNEWDVLLAYRMRMLLAARAHGKRALDGPALAVANPAETEKEARAAARIGYDGKLLIHPSQIAPVRSAFSPSPDQIERAKRIVAATRDVSLAVVDGMMIDQPLITAAQRILARAGF